MVWGLRDSKFEMIEIEIEIALSRALFIGGVRVTPPLSRVNRSLMGLSYYLFYIWFFSAACSLLSSHLMFK